MDGVIRALGEDSGDAPDGVGAELAPLLKANRREVYTWEEADESLHMG